MGLTARLARAVSDQRQLGKVVHKVETMIRQRVHAVALGYEDLNDHDALRDDPVVQTACEREGRLRVRRRYADSSSGRAAMGDCDSSGAGGAVHRLVRAPAEGAGAGLRRDRRPGARPPGGAIFPRVLRLLLLFAAVRVLRPAVAGRLPSSLEHRCVEACLDDIVIAGQTAAPGVAGSSYRVSGRLGVLPAPDVRLVRAQRREVRRGVGPQCGARA